MALALVDKEASKVLEHAALNNPPIKGIIYNIIYKPKISLSYSSSFSSLLSVGPKLILPLYA